MCQLSRYLLSKCPHYLKILSSKVDTGFYFLPCVLFAIHDFRTGLWCHFRIPLLDIRSVTTVTFTAGLPACTPAPTPFQETKIF